MENYINELISGGNHMTEKNKNKKTAAEGSILP